jgi:hypothetical protein
MGAYETLKYHWFLGIGVPLLILICSLAEEGFSEDPYYLLAYLDAC